MHKTVLLKECVDQLNLEKGDTVIDATLGMGGHTIELAKKVGSTGKVITVDMDAVAIEETKKRILKIDKELLERIVFVQDNFRNIDKIVVGQGTSATCVKGILADLGWRIEQINDPVYGLSFNVDAKLNMKLGDDFNKSDVESENAFEIVNNWEVDELTKLFRELGEERYARSISLEIENVRNSEKIETTLQLAKIVEDAIDNRGKKHRRIHPATKVFQALRIQVNGELNSLNDFLSKAIDILAPSGRLAVISFHSIEDRIVKKFFKSKANGCTCPKDFPVCVCGNKAVIKLVRRKPIISTEEELKDNPRARSAKLRVVEKI